MQATLLQINKMCFLTQFGKVPDYTPDEMPNQPVPEFPDDQVPPESPVEIPPVKEPPGSPPPEPPSPDHSDKPKQYVS
jgi:hypothetical protein